MLLDLDKRIWDQQQQQEEIYYYKLTNYISHQPVNINIRKLKQLKLLQALTESYLGTVNWGLGQRWNAYNYSSDNFSTKN